MEWNCRTPFMLFIIQQLAIITSKLIIRLSSTSTVCNSWLNPEISPLNPTWWMVPPFPLCPLISAVGWYGCSLCRDAAIPYGVQSTHRANICHIPSCAAGSSDIWAWWGGTSHTAQNWTEYLDWWQDSCWESAQATPFLQTRYECILFTPSAYPRTHFIWLNCASAAWENFMCP